MSTSSTASVPGPTGSSPASISSICSCPSTRPTPRARSTRRRTVPRVLPMLVFEMQHSIDHYNACAKLVLVQRGVLETTASRAAASLSRISQQLLDGISSTLQLAAGGVRVADGQTRSREGLREPQRLSAAALDAARRRDRLGPHRRRRAVPVLGGDRHDRTASAARSPARLCRRSPCSGWSRPARQAHRGLPAGGVGHLQRDRARGASARGARPSRCSATSTSSGS